MNKIRNLSTSNFVAFLLLFAFTLSILAQTAPPKAEMREVKDMYFGQTIVDNYRWLENLKSDETQKWMRAQADYAREYLNRLPMRSEIFNELNTMNNAGTTIGWKIVQRDNRFFYTKISPGESDYGVYVREGLNGAERLLVNPGTYAKNGKRYSVSSFSPSHDGKLLAFLITAGGAEFGEVRVLDVATGRETGNRIERTRWDTISWMPDGKSFFYLKFQDLPADAPNTEIYKNMRSFRHIIGTKTEDDQAIFGDGVNLNVKLEPSQFQNSPISLVSAPRGSKYLIAQVFSGVSVNSEFYVAPIEAMNQDAASIKWRKIANLEDKVTNISIRGDDVYLLTYKNTPRYKMVRFNLKNSDLTKAETIFPASEAVVDDFRTAKDALYVQTLDGGTRKIYRVDYKTKRAEPIKLPYQGSTLLSTEPFDLDAGIYFKINSWTKSSTHFVYNPKTKTATDTKLIPPFPVDMSDIEFINAKAKSHDGTMIPLVIIYKKGLKRDGSNPTLMSGYGAFGYEHTSPLPKFEYLPWLNRGGVLVYTGVRGGGEYGEEWHLAAVDAKKPNSWKDFIACAEYLIAEKFTSAKHLGIMGGSAGGILISNSITERPDLFGAAIGSVGVYNVLTTAIGVSSLPEGGSLKTEEGFKILLAIDGYYKVKDSVKYPAVMLMHGINDPIVQPWQSAKMAARLQASSASDKPVLLRIDYDAGHGVGTTIQQRNEQNADIFAFLFQQLGATKR